MHLNDELLIGEEDEGWRKQHVRKAWECKKPGIFEWTVNSSRQGVEVR